MRVHHAVNTSGAPAHSETPRASAIYAETFLCTLLICSLPSSPVPPPDHPDGAGRAEDMSSIPPPPLWSFSAGFPSHPPLWSELFEEGGQPTSFTWRASHSFCFWHHEEWCLGLARSLVLLPTSLHLFSFVALVFTFLLELMAEGMPGTKPVYRYRQTCDEVPFRCDGLLSGSRGNKQVPLASLCSELCVVGLVVSLLGGSLLPVCQSS